MNVNVQTETMIENKDMRQKYIDRVEVLDKVKKLFLIPQLEMMTIKQVTDFYEVDYKTMHRVCQSYKDELDSDGMITVTPRYFADFLNGHRCPFKKIEQQKGKMTIMIDKSIEVIIPNVGIRCFPKRAILRIGMVLNNSKVAKEVRTQLLNITEHVAEEKPEILTMEIDKEKELLTKAIGIAAVSGDINELLKAQTAYNAYMNRHVAQIEAERDKAVNENISLVEKNKVLESKAKYHDEVLNSKGTVTPTQVAKMFGMSPQKFHNICNKLKIMYKVGNQWVMYSKYDNKGYTGTKTYYDVYGRSYSTTCFTNKGIEFIVNKFAEIGIEPNKGE